MALYAEDTREVKKHFSVAEANVSLGLNRSLLPNGIRGCLTIIRECVTVQTVWPKMSPCQLTIKLMTCQSLRKSAGILYS
jgi:hypothetical protein